MVLSIIRCYGSKRVTTVFTKGHMTSAYSVDIRVQLCTSILRYISRKIANRVTIIVSFTRNRFLKDSFTVGLPIAQFQSCRQKVSSERRASPNNNLYCSEASEFATCNEKDFCRMHSPVLFP